MQNSTNMRVLELLRFLYERTDESHPATVSDIIAHLNGKGIQAVRQTVYADTNMTSKTSRVQPTPERSPQTTMGAKFPSTLMVQSIWTDILPPARSCSRQPPACMTGS